MQVKRVFFLMVALINLCVASAKVGILYSWAEPVRSRNSAGTRGVLGCAILRTGSAHVCDAHGRLRLVVERGGWRHFRVTLTSQV